MSSVFFFPPSLCRLFTWQSHVESGEQAFSVDCAYASAINAVDWHPERYSLAFAGDLVSEVRDDGFLKIINFQ